MASRLDVASPVNTRGFAVALCVALILSFTSHLNAKTVLTITSTPPGATVELDGIVVGKTPYEEEIPGGYVHGTKSVFGKVLTHQVRLKLTLEGYLPVQADLAVGPRPWVALNGTYHGDYWLLKSDHFNFNLDKAATTFAANVSAAASVSTTASSVTPELTTESLVEMASPAVVRLQTSEGSGSGFLITETGVALTNAHVAQNEHFVVANTTTGQSFQAKVIYVDPKLDLALVQLQGTAFPHLLVADSAAVRVGSSVLAIGSPSKGFQNSVTKGIVSAVGSMPNEPGTWIQTDASINPGNSGGPLLNTSGAVVGITTQKEFISGDGRPLQGIGFALSSADIISVLHRLSPESTALVQARTASADQSARGSGKITISADADDADVFVDGKFVGNTPSVLHVSAGPHKIEVKTAAGSTWERNIELSDQSEVILKAKLKSEPSR